MLSRMALFRVGIAAVVAAAGFAALSISSAALFVQSAEAESGAVAGQAAAAAESNASGGKAVRFGASALPGPSGGPYDAGLLTTLRLPDAVSGRTLRVTDYGATPGNDANDDAAAFRSAIAAATAGDEVLVPDGTYAFKSWPVELKTGVSLRGDTAGAAIVDVQVPATSNRVMIFYARAGVSNLTLSNLKVIRTGSQVMEDVVAIGEWNTSVASASRIAVRNMHIENHMRMAIVIRNATDISVTDNIIRNASSLGDTGEGYGVVMETASTRNNYVANNTIGPVIRHGILIQFSAHHNLIERNTVFNTVYDALDMHGEDEYSNELRYNTAYGSGEGGIGVGNNGGGHYNTGPKNWIHHNEVYGSRYGIHLYKESNTQYIEDNYFHDNSSYGILIHEEGARDILFQRNKVQANAKGISVVNGAGLKLIDNIVTNNAGFGLQTDANTTGYTITGNDFRGNGSPVSLGSTSGTFTGNQQ